MVASTIFKWLHIIKRLGCQVNIWPNSFKKSPENLLKNRNITSKSANQKKRRLPSKKHQFCAFQTNCLAVDCHLYCYVSPLLFFLAKTFIIDKNVFFCVFPLQSFRKYLVFLVLFMKNSSRSSRKKIQHPEIALNMVKQQHQSCPCTHQTFDAIVYL